MKLTGSDLNEHQHDQSREENRTTNQIAPIHHDIGLEPGHGDAIAASLTEGRGENLDDPEAEGDLRHFAVNLRAARYIACHGDQSGCRPSLAFSRTFPVFASTPTS